jgi:hypothetical protein
LHLALEAFVLGGLLVGRGLEGGKLGLEVLDVLLFPLAEGTLAGGKNMSVLEGEGRLRLVDIRRAVLGLASRLGWRLVLVVIVGVGAGATGIFGSDVIVLSSVGGLLQGCCRRCCRGSVPVDDTGVLLLLLLVVLGDMVVVRRRRRARKGGLRGVLGEMRGETVEAVVLMVGWVLGIDVLLSHDCVSAWPRSAKLINQPVKAGAGMAWGRGRASRVEMSR